MGSEMCIRDRGYKGASVHKIEVWRSGMDNNLLYEPGGLGEDLYLAVVSDSENLDIPIPNFHFDHPDLFDALADLIESRVLKLGDVSE